MGWPSGSQAMKGKLIIAFYVYSNNHNAANNNDLSVIPPGSRNYKFPNPESQDRKKGSGIAIPNLTYQATKHLVEISSAVTAVFVCKV